MKYFTKFLCLFLGAAMMLTMAACGSKSGTDANAGADGEKKQLVVATSPDFPPFEFLDGSQIVGIEPALMQAIADKLGMELVWEQVDFDSIIPGIQAERYDVGAAGITITPDRQKNCDFSNPYFLANQVIVVNPGSDIQGKADLAGKTIAVQTGTTAEEYCMDNGYSVLSFASNNDAQAALTSGKADVAEHGSLRGGDDIGGVKFAAHAHLAHHDIAVVPGKIGEGDGRDHFKLRGVRVQRIRQGADIGGDLT